jgi:hypothetical protein
MHTSKGKTSHNKLYIHYNEHCEPMNDYREQLLFFTLILENKNTFEHNFPSMA